MSPVLGFGVSIRFGNFAFTPGERKQVCAPRCLSRASPEMRIPTTHQTVQCLKFLQQDCPGWTRSFRLVVPGSRISFPFLQFLKPQFSQYYNRRFREVLVRVSRLKVSFLRWKAKKDRSTGIMIRTLGKKMSHIFGGDREAKSDPILFYFLTGEPLLEVD